jgi:hypothetical protein
MTNLMFYPVNNYKDPSFKEVKAIRRDFFNQFYCIVVMKLSLYLRKTLSTNEAVFLFCPSHCAKFREVILKFYYKPNMNKNTKGKFKLK